jgi:putative restriction endonuclease
MEDDVFDKLVVGHRYSRPELGKLWGYKGYQALARGVVTPANKRYIILFVTEEKQSSSEQYRDRLTGRILNWEGPNDHFAEDRMRASGANDDEIHVFYRVRHHSDFQYMGRAIIIDFELKASARSKFRLNLVD